MAPALPCAVVLDLLPRYVEGGLRDTTQVLVRQHLAACATCRQALEQTQPRADLLTTAGKDRGHVSGDSTIGLPRPMPRVRRPFWIGAAAVAGLALLLAGGAYLARGAYRAGQATVGGDLAPHERQLIRVRAGSTLLNSNHWTLIWADELTDHIEAGAVPGFAGETGADFLDRWLHGEAGAKALRKVGDAPALYLFRQDGRAVRVAIRRADDTLDLIQIRRETGADPHAAWSVGPVETLRTMTKPGEEVVRDAALALLADPEAWTVRPWPPGDAPPVGFTAADWRSFLTYWHRGPGMDSRFLGVGWYRPLSLFHQDGRQVRVVTVSPDRNLVLVHAELQGSTGVGDGKWTLTRVERCGLQCESTTVPDVPAAPAVIPVYTPSPAYQAAVDARDDAKAVRNPDRADVFIIPVTDLEQTAAAARGWMAAGGLISLVGADLRQDASLIEERLDVSLGTAPNPITVLLIRQGAVRSTGFMAFEWDESDIVATIMTQVQEHYPAWFHGSPP